MMGTLKRNPRNFPKMKVRGARRRQLATWQRFDRSMDNVARAINYARSTIVRLTEELDRMPAKPEGFTDD